MQWIWLSYTIQSKKTKYFWKLKNLSVGLYESRVRLVRYLNQQLFQFKVIIWAVKQNLGIVSIFASESLCYEASNPFNCPK